MRVTAPASDRWEEGRFNAERGNSHAAGTICINTERINESCQTEADIQENAFEQLSAINLSQA